MLIYYIGEKSKEAYFSSETNDYETKNVIMLEMNDNFIKEVVSKSPKELIIDADCILDEGIDSAKLLVDLKNAVGCKIIIIASGYSRESKLVKRLQLAGITFFIFSAVLGSAKEEYRACHRGDSAISLSEDEQSELSSLIKAGEINKNEKKKKSITIGVVGAITRIGTTTVAMQLAKFFMLRGYKTAYFERNNTEFVNHVKSTYKCMIDEDLSKATLSGIDMYDDLSLIKKILQEGYEAIIKDFGVYDANKSVDIMSCNYVVVVCGIKGSELTETTKVLRYFLNNDDVMYFFNFVHESMHEDTKSMMGKLSKKTFFTSYSPEMFILEDKNQDVLDTIFTDVTSCEKKKRRLFNAFKRRQ